MPLNIQPLSDKFGVAITNVDLPNDVDQSLFNEIVDIFVKKRVLIFFAINISSRNIKLPSAGGLARSKCCMTRISGCWAFRKRVTEICHSRRPCNLAGGTQPS